MTQIKVVVVEDSYYARKGIILELREESDIEIIGDCGTLDELREILEHTSIDVAIVDLVRRLDGAMWDTQFGLKAIDLLKNSCSGVHIVVLSSFLKSLDNIRDVVRVPVAVIAAKLQDGSDPSQPELAELVRMANNGRTFYHPDIVLALSGERVPLSILREDTSKSPENRPCLTTRDKEVLRLVCEGRETKEIAAILKIKRRTVEEYISEAAQRMNFSLRQRGRHALASEAKQRGLLDD